jgi:ATP-binding cassette, subfamily B (MDR/TAP), member 1
MGSRFLVDGDVGLSQILTIVLSMMIGALSLGQVAPNARAFGSALTAGTKIFSIIDRDSPLDSSSKSGHMLAQVDGCLELKNVKHIYPSRPDVTVLKNVSLTFPAGKITALVGASGSGKSTIVGLLERFYEPVSGQILFDGHHIQTMNLKWLRQQFALVSQEPTLFNATVFENIANGLIGTQYQNLDMEKKKDLAVNAARTANADDFINNLPNGYDTLIGVGGVSLSGGQKQRIAIARAIVSNPKILLLDEATSALDTNSEELVQKAIEKAAHGRTTIAIAHRLSTIKTADNIVVMEKGRVIEQGTHDELMTRQGAYHKLAKAQQFTGEFKRQRRSEYEIEVEKAFSIEDFNWDADRLTLLSNRSLLMGDVSPTENTTTNQYSLWTLIKQVVSLNREEIPIALVGLFFSIIAGGGIPTQSVFFAEAIISLALPPSEYDQLRSDVNFWSLMYLMLGLVIFFANTIQGWCLAYCSERMLYRVRNKAFRTILRQDVSYFDQHSSSALVTLLSTETTHLAGMSAVTLGSIFGVVTTLIAVVVISLAIGWKLALVCISTMPILLGTGFLQYYILARMQIKRAQVFSRSAEYASEAVSAIRTVATLTMETAVCERYKLSIDKESQSSVKSVLASAAFYAASQSLRFLCIALAFWYGGTLILNLEYTLFEFYICFIAIIFGVQSAGTIFSSAPDISKARRAGNAVKTLFDNRPEIDAWSPTGLNLARESVEGDIEFQDVHFQYPTRPGQPILQGATIAAQAGQYIALVGASGCGKSTAITLMERFYMPSAGKVLLDGRDISIMNVKSYRRHLALVNQEPTLYQGSVLENLLLGMEDGEFVSQDKIAQACKDANIYDFIVCRTLSILFYSILFILYREYS